MAGADELKRLEEEAKKLEKQREELMKKIQLQQELQEKENQGKTTAEDKKFFLAKDSDIFRLITKTLSLMDKKIIVHSCKTAYIYTMMLKYIRKYSKQQLAQYAVIGLLHDLGEFKIQNDTRRNAQAANSAWAHSIYSYLYIRNFSPLGDMGNVVLYHHLALEKFDEVLTGGDRLAAAILCLADRMERLIGEYDSNDSLKTLFRQFAIKENRSEVMEEAMAIALNAMREFNIATQVTTGEYETELYNILDNLDLTEHEKRQYLELLMYAFDFQTDEAFLDTLRTISISEQIGEVMLVSEYERKILSYGTLLYDIGKFAMPIDILRKPGKLTHAEMEIIRSHTAYTEYLLADFFDTEIINIAARHHERMDGSGYPHNIKGEDLTLCERILAVADVVSALSADRSYRKAMSKAKILEILLKDVENNKLCPHVVNALVKKYDIIMSGASFNVQKASKTFVVETAIAYNQLYAALKEI